MARNPDEKKMNEIYKIIQQHRGKRPGQVAALLHIHCSDVTRMLPALEKRD